MAVRVVITIPMLPPKELSPNFRGHWAEVYEGKALLKAMTKLMIPHPVRGVPPLLSNAELYITFIIPNRRHFRDTDNAIASLKPAIDACVDAGIIVDDSPDHLSIQSPITWQVNRFMGPATILEFQEGC